MGARNRNANDGFIARKCGYWYSAVTAGTYDALPRCGEYMKPIYVIPALSHALDVLEDLQTKPQGATLDVLYRDARVSKTSTYRILKTLERRGYVRHKDGYFYSAPISKRLSIGLLSRNDDLPYFKAFNCSIRRASMATETELIECR